MQAFPDAARTFGDIGLRADTLMHLEEFVGTVAKDLRAARPEVGEPRNVLLRCRSCCLVEMNCRYECSLRGRCH